MNKDALESIRENYINFSKYTMHFRTYPSIYDGCKLVQRRMLYAAFSKAPASKMVKLSSMSGYGILLHPHAEATDVIINMAGKHKTTFPLFDTHGNYGDNYGNPASAPRYLECKLNDIARKIYFSLIDEAPFENFEVEEEPLFLPTLFPLAFLQGCFSVGQGTPNPLIPDLQFEDLKKYIINYIKTGQKDVTKNNFVRFVDYDRIRDDNEKDNSICDVLNKGKGSVYYSPKVEIKGNTIVISNLYILANFKSLVDRFKDDIQADKIDIRDESAEERVWVIEKVKNKVFDLDECAKIVKQKFTYKENYCMYFHDEEGKVKPYSLGEIISLCYSKYKEAYAVKINKKIKDLTNQKMILLCLGLMSESKKVKDVITDSKMSDELKINSIKEAINNEYDEYTIRECLNKPIRYLKKDDKAIQEVKDKINSLQNELENIDNTIINYINSIKL